MTTLREAAQQALEALLTPGGAQACSTCQNGPENEYCCRREMWSAVDALRAALAQPQIDPVDEYRKGFIAGQIDMRDREETKAELAQEPVAWLVMDESGYVQHAASWRDAAHEHINDAINEHDLVCARTWRVVPVYTAPPQRPTEPVQEPDLFHCPKCGGPADNGHDRSIPPNPYFCTRCMAEPVHKCPNCASLEAQNTELDRKLAEMEQEEREACAKVCDDLWKVNAAATECAAAIRARGNK